MFMIVTNEIDIVLIDLELPKISGLRSDSDDEKAKSRREDYCHNRLFRAEIKIGTLNDRREGVDLQTVFS